MNNVRNAGPCLATLATFGSSSNPRRQIESLRRGEMVVRNVSIVANRLSGSSSAEVSGSSVW